MPLAELDCMLTVLASLMPQVAKQGVAASDAEQAEHTDGEWLTLICCTPVCDD